MSLLAIGEVADQTGTSVSTVRYYEEIGVIAAAARVGGKRRFAPETLGRIRFVRRAQEAGFSLDEIRTILDDDTGAWRRLVDAKLDELVERRSHLDAMIAMLREVADCGCGAVSACPRVMPT